MNKNSILKDLLDKFKVKLYIKYTNTSLRIC